VIDQVIEKQRPAPALSGREGRPGPAREPRRTDQRGDQLPAGRGRSLTAESGRSDGGPLASFLAHASLEAGEHQAGEGQEAVQLMTVHAAKGLEFDVVFITGLEQGLFPHENAAQERDGLEEERRLMYVAVTRARKRLYLTHAQTRMLHGQTRYCLPSLFLDELPEELLRKINRAAQRDPIAAALRPLRPAPTQRQRAAHWPERAPRPLWRRRHRVQRRRRPEARVQVNFGSRRHEVAGLEYARLTPA
jgi:DNA helicase-2/ATP-dependent DNA helicase PcrA